MHTRTICRLIKSNKSKPKLSMRLPLPMILLNAVVIPIVRFIFQQSQGFISNI